VRPPYQPKDNRILNTNNSGCFSKSTAIGLGFITFLSAVVQIVGSWGEFRRNIEQGSRDVQGIIASVANFFATNVEIPRILLLVFLAITAFSVIRVLLYVWGNTDSLVSNEARVQFRELWLFVKTSGELQTVINRDVHEARCGRCMGRIVGTDTNPNSFSVVRFLKCENGHYVGGKLTYEEYVAEQKKITEELREQEKLREEETKRAYDILESKLNNNEITQEEFDKEMIRPTYARSRAGHVVLPKHDMHPRNAQDFYSIVVDAYQQQFVRRQLEAIPEILTEGEEQQAHKQMKS